MKKIYLLFFLITSVCLSAFSQFEGQPKPKWRAFFIMYPHVNVTGTGSDSFTQNSSSWYISKSHCDSLQVRAEQFKWCVESTLLNRIEIEVTAVVSDTPIEKLSGGGYGAIEIPTADWNEYDVSSYDVYFVTQNATHGGWAGLAWGGNPLRISLTNFMGDHGGYNGIVHEFSHSYMGCQSAVNSRHPSPGGGWADSFWDWGYNDLNQADNQWYKVHPFLAFYTDIINGHLTNYTSNYLEKDGRTFYPGQTYIGTHPSAWRYSRKNTYARWNLKNDFITYEYDDCAGKVLLYDQTIPMIEDVDFTTLRDENDLIRVVGINDYIDTIWVQATNNPPTYTLKYETFGGSTIPDKTVRCNDILTAPNQPTKSGYTFKGWYKEPSGLTEWIFYKDKAPARDFTIYAKWLKNSGDAYINLETATPAESGEGWSYANNIYTIHDNANVTISGTTTTKRILVPPDTTATINLKDANIDVSATSGAVALQVTGANVNLTLSGKNSFKSYLRKGGIEQKITGTLTIDRSTDDDGVLIAIGNEYAAGIGGTGAITSSANNSCGTIIINGGIIYASNTKTAGAGIGGGQKSQTGSVTINGGTVVAIGANGGGAAIGAGSEGTIDAVTINGGTVFARATDVAAVNNGQLTGTTIGANAIVFMNSEKTLYNGTKDPDATVFEDKKQNALSFIVLSESSMSLKVETDLSIPSGKTLVVPYNGVVSQINDAKIQGTVLASYIDGEYFPENYAYGIVETNSTTPNDIKPVFVSAENAVVKVYPNPVSDIMHFNSSEAIKNIIVTDMSGRTVLRTGTIGDLSTSLPANNLLKGIYLVTVETEKSKVVRKIIKN